MRNRVQNQSQLLVEIENETMQDVNDDFDLGKSSNKLLEGFMGNGLGASKRRFSDENKDGSSQDVFFNSQSYIDIEFPPTDASINQSILPK